MQRLQRNVRKNVMHVQSCCFANPNLLHFCHSRCHRRRHLHQEQTEDFVIARASRYTRQWQYGCDSAHQDCELCTFLGSFGRMLLRENFWDWSSLRCNLVHSGHLNLASAWIPYWTCNAELFNKPQVWLWKKKVINTLWCYQGPKWFWQGHNLLAKNPI